MVAAHFETLPLLAVGGRNLEAAEGTWSDGHWADFNPAGPPRLIEGDESVAL
jgi:hypothetical protein